jgi:hypothetical protein
LLERLELEVVDGFEPLLRSELRGRQIRPHTQTRGFGVGKAKLVVSTRCYAGWAREDRSGPQFLQCFGPTGSFGQGLGVRHRWEAKPNQCCT